MRKTFNDGYSRIIYAVNYINFDTFYLANKKTARRRLESLFFSTLTQERGTGQCARQDGSRDRHLKPDRYGDDQEADIRVKTIK